MRWAFVDFTPWDYDGDTPATRPLGGSQSALCYLTEQLARDGHRVLVLNHVRATRTVRGVEFRPVTQARPDWLAGLDAMVVLNATEPALKLRRYASPSTQLILWTQHAHDQPAVAPLRSREVGACFDAVAFVSDWQRDCYRREFALDARRTCVMRNAMAPAFERMFDSAETLAAAKEAPPILAYTSTPFRGLDVLVRMFPQLRRELPDLRLRVFSSMQVYQVGDEEDRRRYADLYRACDETPGIERVGSLTQPALAAELRRATMLAYPNHFAETSCIAAIEALAAGCRVVTSDYGALPETTGGWARLVPLVDDPAGYAERFLAAAREELARWRDARNEIVNHLARQVTAMNAEYTWANRAREWAAWLASA
ncbi:MAG: glycosyltransferase family 4 protein [Pirellulales bacterium]|nr:glycosyltransferase family 4 protein [Pirellulales bacterium]